MTTAITIGMIIIYVAIMMGIGVYTARQTRSVSDFVLGGHSVGSWLTAFAYGTSYFSAVVFIGYAGQFGWTYGVSAAWVGIGNALLGSLLAWIVLGRRTRIMTQSLGAKTMPEYFEKRWNSKGLKVAAAVIVFIFLIPYTASVYNGLSLQKPLPHPESAPAHSSERLLRWKAAVPHRRRHRRPLPRSGY